MSKYDTQEHAIQFIIAIMVGMLIFIGFLSGLSYIWINYSYPPIHALSLILGLVFTGVIATISIHIYYALINSKLKQIEVEKEFYKKYGKIPNIEEALDFYKEHKRLIK